MSEIHANSEAKNYDKQSPITPTVERIRYDQFATAMKTDHKS